MAQINKPGEYFNTKLYTGTGSSNALTGVGFQPDFTWIKDRDNSRNHQIYDVIRGAGYVIYSNLTSAEGDDINRLSSFDSDGFSLGTSPDVNDNNQKYASWNWLGANGTAANTDGSISSTVSANTTSGFSIVSFTGTGSTATVGHGLGATPKMFIVKNRSTTETWRPYHVALGGGQALALNGTNATDTDAAYWSNTNPTSSVFTVGTTPGTNGSGNSMIAYCFAEKKGFSKFGSYTGNGSTDGTFVYTGFKPAFVICKRTNSTGNWIMFDSKRDGFNSQNDNLYPNTTTAEQSDGALDIFSNGFKCTITGTDVNGSGSTYIYMAFAEQPLVGTNNIPATAR